jgi:hypothetical protein
MTPAEETPGPRAHTEDVNEMATSFIIEEEAGTYRGRRHRHNGYYAGDFWAEHRDPDATHENRGRTTRWRAGTWE